METLTQVYLDALAKEEVAAKAGYGAKSFIGNYRNPDVRQRRRLAQEGAVPLPDPSYGASADSYQSPTDLPMPAPDDPSNPNTVTIPIPGGGEITVDGPNAPSDTSVPTLPGSRSN